MFKYFIVSLIGIASLLRFIGLKFSPPGFYIDEAMGAAHSVCYQQTGRDLFDRIGLFSQIDFFGFQSAPFLIGGALWTSIFGTGFFGFRSFMAFVGVMTILAIFVLVRGLTQDKSKALWAGLFAAFLPWAFQFSRISWDAPLAVAFLIWGLAVIFFDGIPSELPTTRRQWITLVTGSILLGLASYTYAPMRVQAALMVTLLPGFRWRQRLTLMGIFGLMNLPVLPYYSDPMFTARSKLLALTSSYQDNPYRNENIFGLMLAFIKQVFIHFKPSFLILEGDRNLRHSIQAFNMLDFVTFAGLLLGLITLTKKVREYKKIASSERVFIALAFLGIFGGIAPAALTWESVPHAIRSLGAWPFFVMFAMYGWTAYFQRFSKLRGIVLAASCILFTLYLRNYFFIYPQKSGVWFDSHLVPGILQTHQFPQSYGPVARAYYRMAHFGERCTDVRKSLQ